MEKMGQGSLPEKIIVNKFGGGILIKNFIPLMVERLREQIKDGYSPIVVISALPGVTDELLKNSDESFLKTLKEKHIQIMTDINFNKEWLEKAEIELNKLFADLKNDLKLTKTVLANEDKIIAYGEKLSATIFTFYLNMLNLPAQRFLAEEIPIITDDNFKNANIVYEISEKNIQENLQEKIYNSKVIPVIPGFTGRTAEGKTTTLGRGGTDTTACFVGSALRVEKVILWKDVNGVLSTDPKIVPEAKTIENINYQEAKRAGKIIHDKAIQYVKLFNTPLEIASITNPELKTEVSKIKQPENGAKIISYKKDTIFMLGNFDAQHVNSLNNLLIKLKIDLNPNTFLYKNCAMLKAVVKTDNINKVIKVLHKEFIR